MFLSAQKQMVLQMAILIYRTALRHIWGGKMVTILVWVTLEWFLHIVVLATYISSTCKKWHQCRKQKKCRRRRNWREEKIIWQPSIPFLKKKFIFLSVHSTVQLNHSVKLRSVLVAYIFSASYRKTRHFWQLQENKMDRKHHIPITDRAKL